MADEVSTPLSMPISSFPNAFPPHLHHHNFDFDSRRTANEQDLFKVDSLIRNVSDSLFFRTVLRNDIECVMLSDQAQTNPNSGTQKTSFRKFVCHCLSPFDYWLNFSPSLGGQSFRGVRPGASTFWGLHCLAHSDREDREAWRGRCLSSMSSRIDKLWDHQNWNCISKARPERVENKNWKNASKHFNEVYLHLSPIWEESGWMWLQKTTIKLAPNRSKTSADLTRRRRHSGGIWHHLTPFQSDVCVERTSLKIGVETLMGQ